MPVRGSEATGRKWGVGHTRNLTVMVLQSATLDIRSGKVSIKFRYFSRTVMAEIISCGLRFENCRTAGKPRNPHRSNSCNHFIHPFVTAHSKRAVHPNWKFTICFFKAFCHLLLKDSDCTDPCLPFNIIKPDGTARAKNYLLHKPCLAYCSWSCACGELCHAGTIFYRLTVETQVCMYSWMSF